MKISDAKWIFLDTETTGLKVSEGHRVIELGLVTVQDLSIVSDADYLINPGMPIPPRVVQITHITDDMVADKPPFSQIAPAVAQIMEGSAFIAAFNKDFDRDMLANEFKLAGMKMPEKIWLDPITWARTFMQLPDNKLKTVANQFKVSLENAHRAHEDARASAEVMLKFMEWGVAEAGFPDDVEQLKEMERGWRRAWRTQGNILNPLKKNVDGKRQVVMTGEPGKYAQNVYDNYNRDRLMKLGNRGRWGK